MNLFAVLGASTPAFVDVVSTRVDHGNRVPLMRVLDAVFDFSSDWNALRPEVDQDLPSPAAIRGAVDRLPDRMRAQVEAAYLLLLPSTTWAAWVSNAVRPGPATSWVQYVRGSGPPLPGIVMPQDSDPAPQLAAFRYDPARERQLLLALTLGLNSFPPYVDSFAEQEPTGCDMDDDGHCVHDEQLCTESCGLLEVLSRSGGDSLACRCHN